MDTMIGIAVGGRWTERRPDPAPETADVGAVRSVVFSVRAMCHEAEELRRRGP